MQSPEEIAQNAERRKKELFTNGWYGYQLNVNNDELNKLYNAYRHAIGCCIYPLSDAQRISWEKQLWKYFQKIYYSCYKCRLPDYDNQPLRDNVIGWQLTQLKDIINCRLNIDKAIKQLNFKGEMEDDHNNL